MNNLRAKLGSCLCRGVAEAINRSNNNGRAVVLIDSGEDRQVTNLVSQGLSSWRFPMLTLLGVMESDVHGYPDFRHVDQKHTHFVVLRKRNNNNNNSNIANNNNNNNNNNNSRVMMPKDTQDFVSIPSLKADVAEKLAHSFSFSPLLDLTSALMTTTKHQKFHPTNNNNNNSSTTNNNNIINSVIMRRDTTLAEELLLARYKDTRKLRERGQVQVLEHKGISKHLQKRTHMSTELLSIVHGPLGFHSNGPVNDRPDDRDGGVAFQGTPGRPMQLKTPVVPVVMLVISGGVEARCDALHACRKGWDIIVFAGTGGAGGVVVVVGLAAVLVLVLVVVFVVVAAAVVVVVAISNTACDYVCSGLADDIARRTAELKSQEDTNNNNSNNNNNKTQESDNNNYSDILLEEIVSDGNVSIIELGKDTIEDVSGLTYSRLNPSVASLATTTTGDEKSDDNNNSQSTDLLVHAWKCYAEFNTTAANMYNNNIRLEGLLMFFGLAATVMVIIDAEMMRLYGDTTTALKEYMDGGHLFFRFFISISSICIGVIVSIKNRFNFHAKWTAFRCASVRLRREINQYRCGGGVVVVVGGGGGVAAAVVVMLLLLLLVVVLLWAFVDVGFVVGVVVVRMDVGRLLLSRGRVCFHCVVLTDCLCELEREVTNMKILNSVFVIWQQESMTSKNN